MLFDSKFAAPKAILKATNEDLNEFSIAQELQ